MHDIVYAPVSQSDAETLHMIAGYIYHLDIEFYSALSTDLETALAKIVLSLKDPGSDLGAGFVALQGSTPFGYVSYFPYQQKMTRNLASLKAMLDFSDPIAREIAKETMQFHNLLAPINNPCFYLNKILVFKDYLGKSFGIGIFNGYLEQSVAANLPPMFHVKFDNESAMKFYSRNGFYAEQSDFRYLLCKKSQI